MLLLSTNKSLFLEIGKSYPQLYTFCLCTVFIKNCIIIQNPARFRVGFCIIFYDLFEDGLRLTVKICNKKTK